MLQNGANIEAKNNHGATALHAACSSLFDCVKAVEILVEKGAKINTRDSLGITPLHLAASHGQNSILDILLQNYANIEASNNHGRTPLHAACGSFFLSVKAVEKLVEKGAKINAKDSLGFTPLHLAASHGQNLILEMLLKNGANIEAETNLGHRSLHFAVNIPNGEIASDYEKAAKILIQMGARLDIKGGDGQAPIHLAVLKRRSSMVAMLVKNGGL